MLSLFSLAILVVVVIWALKPVPAERSPINFHFSDLWDWHGTVDRDTYAVVGVVGFAIKHNMDRIIATLLFGRRFTPLNYWIAPVDAIRFDRLSTADAKFLLTMLVPPCRSFGSAWL